MIRSVAEKLNFTINPSVSDLDLIATFVLVNAALKKLNIQMDEFEIIERVLKFIAFEQFSNIDFSMNELEKWLLKQTAFANC